MLLQKTRYTYVLFRCLLFMISAEDKINSHHVLFLNYTKWFSGIIRKCWKINLWHIIYTFKKIFFSSFLTGTTSRWTKPLSKYQDRPLKVAEPTGSWRPEPNHKFSDAWLGITIDQNPSPSHPVTMYIIATIPTWKRCTSRFLHKNS